MKFYSILLYSFLIRAKHKKTRDPLFSLYSTQCHCGGFGGKREEGCVCWLLAATAHLQAAPAHTTITWKASMVWGVMVAVVVTERACVESPWHGAWSPPGGLNCQWQTGTQGSHCGWPHDLCSPKPPVSHFCTHEDTPGPGVYGSFQTRDGNVVMACVATNPLLVSSSSSPLNGRASVIKNQS